MKSKAKILIVEDNAITAKGIQTQIKNIGYNSIDIATTYNKAMSKIKKNRPDLILLDINLKGEYNGIDIANEKEVLNKIPIIYITGDDEIQTEDLIETNPKAYISKPIKDRDRDLKVAISLALMSDNRDKIVQIGYGFSFDCINKVLMYQNRLIKISKNEKLLLERLIEGIGEVVYFSELEIYIWGYESKTEGSLRTLVWNLKKKLNPNMIENIKSFGYKLNLPKDGI